MSRLRRRSRGARGIALLMVLGLIGLLTAVVAEFMLQSSIDMALSLNARDELQAELNALSALRMRAIILKQQTQLRALMTQGPVAALMGGGAPPAGGGQATPAGPTLGPILEQIPVTCNLLSQIASKVERDALPGDSGKDHSGRGRGAEVGDFFPGDCDATSKSEHGKMAINLLRSGIQGNGKRVSEELVAILSNPVLRRLFEEDDRSGSHAESPRALVNHITDYIDANHTEEGSFGDEDRYYQYLRDPYRAKNAPFDSVAELKLVHGVNDLIYALLRHNVSVYVTSPTTELSTASTQLIALGLLSAGAPGVPVEQLMGAVGIVLSHVQQLKAVWQSPTLASLKAAIAAAGAKALFDDKQLAQTFSETDSATWYTIEATGEVGNARRTITAVFQTGEGSFYYARLD